METVEMVQSSSPCVDCQELFMRPKQKGRPPTRCPGCKEINEAKKEIASKVKKPVSPNLPPQFGLPPKLWEGGDVVPTRADLPRGAEAQCTACMRIFTSDTACEMHKYYRMPKTTHCKTPSSLGMIAIERRGLPVWMPVGSSAEEEVDLTDV